MCHLYRIGHCPVMPAFLKQSGPKVFLLQHIIYKGKTVFKPIFLSFSLNVCVCLCVCGGVSVCAGGPNLSLFPVFFFKQKMPMVLSQFFSFKWCRYLLHFRREPYDEKKHIMREKERQHQENLTCLMTTYFDNLQPVLTTWYCIN